MSLIQKWNEILRWQSANAQEPLGDLAEPITEQQVAAIEGLLGEPLPVEFKLLYALSNGQQENGTGLLFEEGFVGSDEIMSVLDMILSINKNQIKPANRFIEYPEKSQPLIKKIVDFYLSHAPKNKLFGLIKSWYKIEFSCRVGSYEGPYFYKSESTPSNERIVFDIDDYAPIAGLIAELYELERTSYNWDFLYFEVFSDGNFKVDRKDDNNEEVIRRTSTPDHCIKKVPYNIKWIPVFSDYGGNYIGIDLDPDINGVKGQIINFGRDEEDMFVYADSLEGFFDLILSEITNNNGASFNRRLHLHGILGNLAAKYRA